MDHGGGGFFECLQPADAFDRTLDAHERALGEADASPVERERVKVVPRDEQVEISRGGVSAPVA